VHPQPTAVDEPIRPSSFIARHDRAIRFAILVLIYLLVAHVLPRPANVNPAGWRITGIFLATIAGLMLQPLPGAAVVLIGLMMFVLVGRMPMQEALAGFSSPTVWLVVAAMMIARVLRATPASPDASHFYSSASSARARLACRTR
jgi:DASS family divalent anion:Na+ symporter